MKLPEMRKQANLMIIEVTTSTKTLIACCEFLYIIAQNEKPNVIRETLLPAFMKMCKMAKKLSKLLTTVPAYKNPIVRRTESVSKTSRNNCRPGLNSA
jgi:hypothetical protein